MNAILTKYLPATDHRLARIIATADGQSNRATVSAPSDDTAYHVLAAFAVCRKLDWAGELIMGHTHAGRAFVFADGPRYQIPA